MIRGEAGSNGVAPAVEPATTSEDSDMKTKPHKFRCTSCGKRRPRVRHLTICRQMCGSEMVSCVEAGMDNPALTRAMSWS